jgi:hypothetical protein
MLLPAFLACGLGGLLLGLSALGATQLFTRQFFVERLATIDADLAAFVFSAHTLDCGEPRLYLAKVSARAGHVTLLRRPVTLRRLGVTLRRLGVTPQELGVTLRRLGVTLRRLGVTPQELGVTLRRLGVTPQELGVTLRRLGVTLFGFRVTLPVTPRA